MQPRETDQLDRICDKEADRERDCERRESVRCDGLVSPKQEYREQEPAEHGSSRENDTAKRILGRDALETFSG